MADQKTTDEPRDMTPDEARWWAELKALLRRQPRGIELHARCGGELGIAPVGAYRATLDQHGNADAVDSTEWDAVTVRGMDGRDSHL